MVIWLKDNKPLDDVLADRISQTEAAMSSYRLDIKNCSERDTGAYTAKATTGAEVTTCTAQLVVGQCKFLRKTSNDRIVLKIFEFKLM